MKDNNNKGQVFPMVIGLLLLLVIIVPVMVNWLETQTRWSRKNQLKSVALNLADAAVERGLWKLKSSTWTWEAVSKGQIIPGYNFDKVYTDISGGIYRIRFSSGPQNNQVTIIGEGKDTTLQEVKAIKVIYQNQDIPGAIISKGNILLRNAFEVHWGPIMSHLNIELQDEAKNDYFPRKFSRQVVIPRDTNGLTPPNTDGKEWWSDYPVGDLPILNFEALRSSAATNVVVYRTYDRTIVSGGRTYDIYVWKSSPAVNVPSGIPVNLSTAVINTLNVYGCSKMSNYTGIRWWEEYERRRTSPFTITTTTLSTCNRPEPVDHSRDCQNLHRHPLSKRGRVWYWDSDANFTGGRGVDGTAIIGDVIIRGNFVNYTGDNLYYTDIGLQNCKVPTEAYMEYQVIDTSTLNQYPADDGFRKVRTTFRFGAETWSKGPQPAANTDVGLKGFLYVEGNYTMEGPMDIYGAVWIVGDVTRAQGVAERSIIFFDDSIDLPTLNLVLVRKSWQEIAPSNIPW